MDRTPPTAELAALRRLRERPATGPGIRAAALQTLVEIGGPGALSDRDLAAFDLSDPEPVTLRTGAAARRRTRTVSRTRRTGRRWHASGVPT